LGIEGRSRHEGRVLNNLGENVNRPNGNEADRDAGPQGAKSDVAVRLRARVNGETTKVTLLMLHPMETGLRRDLNGVAIPPDFISLVRVRHRGADVFEARMTIATASDPLLSFKFLGGNAGDPIEIEWQDNHGNSGRYQATIT
jgi:sulfur-oxidizing protein SoxZ